MLLQRPRSASPVRILAWRAHTRATGADAAARCRHRWRRLVPCRRRRERYHPRAFPTPPPSRCWHRQGRALKATRFAGKVCRCRAPSRFMRRPCLRRSSRTGAGGGGRARLDIVARTRLAKRHGSRLLREGAPRWIQVQFVSIQQLGMRLRPTNCRSVPHDAV